MRLLFPFLTIQLLFFVVSISAQVCPTATTQNQVLLAGDSWAQYMWDDGTYNQIFEKFGFGDVKMVSQSLGSDPGPGYTGSEYAISGSEARQWADTANYPWIANVIAELNANPGIHTVVLSIGGNDILAAKSGGGWYQDMDVDVPGSEAALFATIRDNTFTIVDAIQAAHPSVSVLISSYDYPNFNTGFWCGFYACPKREDLSYNPGSPISDAELNQMMITVETERLGWLGMRSQLHFDNSIGLMHYYYGDGTAAPGTLPYPDQTLPYDPVFYGGNPALPALRSNFRAGADPIHLDAEGYEYKIINQTKTYFMPLFRGDYDATIFSNGGVEDGWSSGGSSGTDAVRVGDTGPSSSYHGILSFDTSSLPDDADITSVSLYIMRDALVNANPFQDAATFGAPMVDVVSGSFGAVMVENGDATAPADAVDAGCFHGTVSADDYALRIDLNMDGLAAINLTGTTQFRIYFPNRNAAQDYVAFKTGNATLDSDITTESIGEYMGDARPFLDIAYVLPLPVELAAFTAKENNGRALLDWQTAWEEDFEGFFVEHSADGRDWLDIGFVAGVGASNYQFVHDTPLAGNNYYRLRMTDKDGSYEYSETRTVRISRPVDNIKVYPNPFSNELVVNAPSGEPFMVELFDALGRRVYHAELAGGTHLLPLTGNGAAGLYCLHITRNGEKRVEKLMRR